MDPQYCTFHYYSCVIISKVKNKNNNIYVDNKK